MSLPVLQTRYLCGVARLGCDPVGLRDIADRLGVPRPTVKGWNLRRLMPPPTWTASGLPLWNWPVIERWLKREAPALGIRIARKAAE